MQEDPQALDQHTDHLLGLTEYKYKQLDNNRITYQAQKDHQKTSLQTQKYEHNHRWGEEPD